MATDFLTSLLDTPRDTPTGVQRLLLEARDQDGATWHLNDNPLVEAHESRLTCQEAIQRQDGTMFWQRVDVPEPYYPQGRFLCGPTTDTPDGLKALGLSRTSIWRSLKRGWYTLGYADPHEGGEVIDCASSDAQYLREALGLSRSTANRAMRRGYLIHRDPRPTAKRTPMPQWDGQGGFAVLREPMAFAYRQVVGTLDLLAVREAFAEQIPDLIQMGLEKCWARRHVAYIQCWESYFATIIRRKVKDEVEKQVHFIAINAVPLEEAIAGK